MRVIRSTLALNEAAHENGTGGGLLATRGTVHLESSTVSGNRANASGGGVLLLVSGVPPLSGALIVRDSTIVENVANDDAGTGDTTGDGGGISFSIGTSFTGDFELHNSIVAGNLDLEGAPLGFQVRPDVHCGSNVQLVASGTSLVGSNEGCSTLLPAGMPNAAGDWVGSAGAEIDPDLQALGDYGGPTPTHRPAPNLSSPTIDQGSCPDAIEDQRGFGDAGTGMRRVDVPDVANAPDSDSCDIGAFEFGSNANVDPTIFADGFEDGHTLRWTSEAP